MFVTCFFCRRRRRRRRHRHRAHKHRLRDRDRDRPRPKAPPRPPGGDEAAGAGDESDDDEVLATLACFAAMPQPVLRRARDLTPQPAEIVYTEWMHPSRRAPRLTGYSVLLSWLVWLADFLFLLNLIPGDAFRVMCGDNLAY